MPNPPANSIRTVISGVLPSGETFACGFWAQANSDDAQFALTQYSGVVAGSFTGNLMTTAVKGQLAGQTRFTRILSYLYKGGPTAAFVADSNITAVAGTSAVVPLPDQIAEVVTFNTGIPGRSTRGRTYWPALTTDRVAATTGQIITADATTLANAWGAFLSGIKDTTNGRPPVVVSSTHGSMTPITSVAVDTVWDTQRRRRNKIVATAIARANVT